MGAPPEASDLAAIANDVTAALLESLDRLSELQRAVLSLRWTNGMTYEQVANVLSISPQAARQHASRAQRVLRPLLLRFLDE
jgi:RNA polymerase sigma-70 factor (ECF subfamily)